ncbi:hypothetical protein BCV71DRAFT_257396 [Rhizopus microsporus]|uniref:Reverse transcriptase zinc-binding domain-containing protein n=1 Tax=Rhizopus microsporus TaxID=58291 RepID=A0A1X0RU20_RHIZD|nr:hypothetical protein BCV71DRAFT_257396 [Rhizopus microsporus]
MPKNVPFRRIILDLCKRDQTFGCLIPLPNNDSSSTALCAIRKGLFPRRRTVQTTLQFIPEISRIAFGPPRDLSILGSQVSVPDRFDNVSFLDALMTLLVSLGFLWHKDYDLLTQPCHPPLALPGSLLLRPQYWQTFWYLTIPPMAVTPLFRLLHGYIPTAALQHTWNLSVTTSPLCRLCQQDTETSFHLFFSIFKRYSLPDKFLTADEIWSVLTSFVPIDEQTTADTDVLYFFGAVIATLWKYHWRCVFDDTPWCTTAVVNSFELEHSVDSCRHCLLNGRHLPI